MVEEKWIERSLERCEADVREIRACIEKLPTVLEIKYVTKAEWTAAFLPVRNLVFGLAGMLLGGIFLYLLKIALVGNTHP